MSMAPRDDPRCQQVQEAILLGMADDDDRAHRDTCAACQAHSAELDEVRAAFDAVSRHGLDDLQRARIQAGLMERLEQPAPRADQTPRAGGRVLRVAAWAAAALVVLALGVLLQRQLRPEPSPTPGANLAAASDPRLVPYLISGPSLVGYSTDLGVGKALRAVDIPRGGYLRAALVAGPAGPWSRRLVGRVTLVGPARVSAVGRGAKKMELRLEGGLLLARVIPGQGRTVRVTSGAVTTTVLGTVFAVEARRGSPVQVAVSRGVVSVAVDGSAPIRVAAGQRWSRGATSVQPLGPVMKRLLTDHQRGLEPSLPKESGTLLLSGSPMAARARLGRDVIGKTPLAALLPVGPATVSLSAQDHHSATITAQIQRGKVARLGYSLEARPGGRSKADGPVPVEPTPADQPVPTKSLEGQDRAAPPARRPGHRARPDEAAAAAGAADASVRPQAPAPDMGVSQTVVKPETAETLYRRAEQAMRAGTRARARDLLTQLLQRFAADPLASTALLELATLAYDRGDGVACRRYVRRLLARKKSRVHQDPAHFLLCRLALKENKKQQARYCLEKFRARFPASPHDQQALYTLGRLALTAQDCAAARKLFRRYLGKYPQGAFVNQVTKLYATCTKK